MKTSIYILLFTVHFGIAPLQGQDLEDSENTVGIRCTASIQTDTPPLYIVDGVPVKEKELLSSIDPQNIASIEVIKEGDALSLYGTLGRGGVVLIKTKDGNHKEEICKPNTLPFRVHCIENDGWVIQQDIYNALRARVPSLTISNTSNPVATPAIRIRGNDAPIVLLDGIRVDASILNTLNPEDIESIQVVPSAAGTNYFLNGYRAN